MMDSIAGLQLGFANALTLGNLAITIPLGIAIAFAIWIVFSQVLMLNLPAGPLERLFFGAAP